MIRAAVRVVAVVAALAATAVFTSVDANVQTVGLFINDPAAYDGYTIFTPISYGTTYLIDNEGRLIHSWPGESGLTPYLLDDGSLMRPVALDDPEFDAPGGTGRVEVTDWDGSLTWQFEYSTEDYLLHHDIEPLPNGNVLMFGWERKTAAEAVAEGRDPALVPQGEVWPEHIIEVEPTGPTSGNIVWEWHVWDHLVQDFDAGQDNYGVVADHPELIDINFGDTGPDWQHANGIDYNAELDQIIFSVRAFSEFWVIDHSTSTAEAAGHTGGDSGKGGDLLYRWGNPQAYDRGTAEDQMLFLQHDAQWIEPGLPGEGNILVFNNGVGRPGGDYSSVDELTSPVDEFGNYAINEGEAFGPTSLHWTYSDPPAFYAAFISGAVRLPNGNTLVDSGPQGLLFEVTSVGETVWRYVSPVSLTGPVLQGASPQGSAIFRAYRHAASHPGLIDKDLTPGSAIEVADSDKDSLSDSDEQVVYGTDPLLPDTDGDGCRDGAEVLLSADQGGERDPLNEWDFYDVPGLEGEPPDGIIDLSNDVLGVVIHYAPTGEEPQYDIAFDRGPTEGPNSWNMTAPDGVIDLSNDILGVISQHLHDCR